MLKYLSKFFLEILPSVVATVVGAYIVNHYISPRNPSVDASRAAVVAPAGSQPAAQPGTAEGPPRTSAAPVHEAKPEPLKAEPKPKAVAKAPVEKTAVEQAKSDPKSDSKADSKSDSRPDPAKLDTEGRRFVSRDKPADKPAPPAPAETAAAPATDDHRDAADLARAALERLRASEPAARPVTDPPAVREAPRERVNVVNAVPAAPVTPATPPAAEVQPAVPPLPPPVSVALPADRAATGSAPDSSRSRSAEADRLVPPADIPGPPPLDLQANGAPKKKSVADDMLSAARSMFQSVVPQ